LVKGEAKTALIDTVNPGFEDEFVELISKVSSVDEIDYVIMNNTEPDHASAISYVLRKYSKANLLVTKKGADAAKLYFNIPEDRIRVITDGETIDLGGKTLRFIVAPMLHWPETMFSYLEEDGVLFSFDPTNLPQYVSHNVVRLSSIFSFEYASPSTFLSAVSSMEKGYFDKWIRLWLLLFPRPSFPEPALA
jgi:flavorubredoxin